MVSFDIQQPLPNRNYFYSAEIIDDGSLLFVSQYDSEVYRQSCKLYFEFAYINAFYLTIPPPPPDTHSLAPYALALHR